MVAREIRMVRVKLFRGIGASEAKAYAEKGRLFAALKTLRHPKWWI